MNDFLRKVVAGDGVRPPEVCLQSFNQNFKDAINVEWFIKESYSEAIFYKNKLEHIAIFSPSGDLREYRLNLPLEFLPEPIQKSVLSKGEIMSSVMRNKGNLIEYEVIVRDIQLNRYLIILSDLGKISEEKRL